MTAITPTQVAPEGASKKTFRPDIQGLRMVAVVAVILDHLLGWPSGGFVGVDVFFVISGFLITGLLLREHARTGTISFVGFYKRRIKRIMPAATLVILFTVGVGLVLFASSRARETMFDGIASFFFAANWNFAAQGTDYFQLGGPVSPLQHYWSLSVEEQFYFLWPWMMLATFVLVGRRRRGEGDRRAHRAVGLVMGIVVVASFGWAMWETVSAPTWAYFSTFSRAWELGVGALVAVIAARGVRLSLALRTSMAWLGLAGIVAAVFIVSADNLFPAPWAALPVLATALVIFAGSGGEQPYLWPITNRFSTYLGNISYSLYLWHFPMIIFSLALFGEGVITNLLALFAMVVVSVASYHLWEDRIRRSTWLEPEKRERRGRPPGQAHAGFTAWGLGSVAVGAAVLSVLALTPPAPPVSAVSQSLSPIPQPTAPEEVDAAADELTSEIQIALNSADWPELVPAIGEAGSAAAPELAAEAGCMHPSDLTDQGACMYGTGDKTAIIIGDSVAVAWMPALRAALEGDGYKVRAIGFGSCPFVFTEIELGNRPDETARCNAAREPVVELVELIDPQLVILSNNQGGYGALASKAEGSTQTSEWVEARTEAIEELSGNGRTVAILAPPPVGAVPEECATAFSSPSDCESGVGADWKAMVAADRQAAQNAGGLFIDSLSWFCYNNRCPIFVGNTPVRTDQIHMTATFGARIAPLLRAALLDAE